MARLILRLVDADSATATLRNAEMDLVWRGGIDQGVMQTLKPGHYLLDVVHEDGSNSRRVVHVEEPETTVGLEPMKRTAVHQNKMSHGRLPHAALSLFTTDGEVWTEDLAPTREILRASRSRHMRILRVALEDRPSVLVALPEHVARIEIATTPTARPVRIIDAQPHAARLNHLMQTRQFDHAAALATQSLGLKYQEPIRAVEGAIALTRLVAEVPDTDRPPLNWFHNLSRDFRWIPDGPVALAWFGLYLGLHDADTARTCLLEGASRGMPLLTDTLRLLHDGLQLAAMEESDTEAQQAFAIVRRWWSAAVLTVPHTTLLGAHPERIGPEAEVVEAGVSASALNASWDNGWLTVDLI